jgi:hypothetical protein
MVDLAAETVLSAWESGVAARGHRRALAMLGVTGEPDAANLPLGSRDALLLGLFRGVRGPKLDALAECPACATTLEVQLDVAELLDGYGAGHAPASWRDVDLGSVVVHARCPTTADLIAVAAEQTPELARDALVSRCVSEARRPEGVACGGLSDAEVERLGRHFEGLDPLVDIRIDVGCAECGHRWSALLDVPALVWAQVQGVGRRLLREVDALAVRYGWSQAEILGMSEGRRHAYLDLA